MLITDLGEVKVAIDGIEQQIEANKLNNVDKKYVVDARYEILVDLTKAMDNVSVTCILNSQSSKEISKIIESGEGLALVSFYHERTKLSIGVEEGGIGTVCEYVDNGINVIVKKNSGMQKIVFYIAWLTMQDEEKEDIYTWFAADPTLS